MLRIFLVVNTMMAVYFADKSHESLHLCTYTYSLIHILTYRLIYIKLLKKSNNVSGYLSCFLNKLVDSVPHRSIEVIKNKGKSIKYKWKDNKINIEFIFFHSQKHNFNRKFNFFQSSKEENFCLFYLHFYFILQYEIIQAILSIFVLVSWKIWK